MLHITLEIGRLTVHVNLGGFRGWHLKCRRLNFTQYLDLQGLHSRFRCEIEAPEKSAA